MTEEQIEQNAEEYASKVAPALKHKTGIPLAINHTAKISFIAGAHSRDEEIREFQKHINQLEEYLRDIKTAVNNFNK